MPPAEAAEKAQSAVNKALRIDSSLNEANLPLGGISAYHWDTAGAAEHFKLVKDVYGLRYYSSTLMNLDRKEESIAAMKQAVEMDPLSLATNNGLGARYFWAGQYDQPIANANPAICLESQLCNFSVVD